MTPGRRVALIAVLAAGSTAAAHPVHAAEPADDQLVLSVDGSTWTPDVATPLLDPDLVWVPGDVASGTLYARNVSEENATAAVTVHLDGGPDGAGDALVDALDVRVRTGTGPWSEAPRAVITDLPPGEELPIAVEVEFDPSATNATQLRTAQLDVVVTLSATGSDDVDGADPGADGAAGPGVDGPGSLPRTGTNLLGPAVIAVTAVLLGRMLLRFRGRSGKRPHHG
jgi:hypothetical protein